MCDFVVLAFQRIIIDSESVVKRVRSSLEQSFCLRKNAEQQKKLFSNFPSKNAVKYHETCEFCKVISCQRCQSCACAQERYYLVIKFQH